MLPAPPSSIQASPEPSAPDVSTNLLAFIKDLKDGKTLAQYNIKFSIPAEELERFEQAVGRDKTLSRFYRKKLRYEWDSTNCIFTILKAGTEIQEIYSRISQYLEVRLRELAESRHVPEGLDPWEQKRMKELVDLIKPLPLRKLDIGRSRMSPDICFTSGTTDSLLGLAQKHVEPLVVFEVRCVDSLTRREDVERRVQLYLEVSGQTCPFRHHVKTVVLIHYLEQGMEIQFSVSRLRHEDGKGIISTPIVESSCRAQPGYIGLTLSDFLPQDAIELGFMQDETGRRACDGVEVGIAIAEMVRQTRGMVMDENCSTLKRGRRDSLGELQERPASYSKKHFTF